MLLRIASITQVGSVLNVRVTVGPTVPSHEWVDFVGQGKLGQSRETSHLHKIVKLSLALWLESVEWTGEGTGVDKCKKKKKRPWQELRKERSGREGNEGKGVKSVLYLSHSSFPNGAVVCFHIRVIVRQSDPMWWFSSYLNAAQIFCP